MEFYQLKNGVRVVLVPMPGVESLAVGTYVGVGSRSESSTKAGISHFLEHMAFKGTSKYPTQQSVSYLEGLGAIQNAATSLDYTSFYCKIPADKWQEALDMVIELTLRPLLPENEVEAEKRVIIEEIKWGQDHPEDLIGDVLQKCLYPNHPLGEPVAGHEHTVAAFTRSDVLGHHSSYYVPQNMVVGMAGKLSDIAAIKAQIEASFVNMHEGVAPVVSGFSDTQVAPVVEIETKPELKQVFIALATRGVTETDPRRFALSVLNSYLGHGASSRFYQEIREKRGLCYSISSGDNRLSDTGYWGVFAGLNRDKLPEAVLAILEEMKLVTTELIPEKVLAEAKEKIRGPLVFSMENPLRQLGYYAKQVLDRPEEVLDYDTVINRLMGVTAEQIRELAKELFVTEKLSLAVVGPIEQDQKQDLLKLLHL